MSSRLLTIIEDPEPSPSSSSRALAGSNRITLDTAVIGNIRHGESKVSGIRYFQMAILVSSIEGLAEIGQVGGEGA
jgi:hypothetical protein